MTRPSWCFLVLSFALLANLLSRAATADEVDVYLLSGQSNMVGVGQVAELPTEFRQSLPGTFFWNGSDFENLDPGKTRLAGKGNRFGPEVGLAFQLANNNPTGRKIYLIKFAVGGMPLDHHFDRHHWIEGEPQPERTNFYPGESPNDPNQGKLYRQLVTTYQAGFDRLVEQGHTPKLRGFVWMQGEADRRSMESAKNYGKNLRRLIDRIREDTSTPNLPACFGLVLPHPEALNRKQEIAALHRAMRSADMGSGKSQAIARTRLVETHECELAKDQVHFNTNGQLALGKKFAMALDEAAASGERFEIWREQVPGFPADYEHLPPTEIDREHITEVSKAYLKYFPSRHPHPNRASVIVFPGGGYRVLADLKEGDRVAQFLADRGFHAFVLRYRVSRNNPTREPFQFPGPLYDARRAIEFVKQNADRFDIAADQVGVMGFSAGGHLASMAATRFNEPMAGEILPLSEVEKRDLRPAFAALIYPVATMIENDAHRGSRTALFGTQPSEKQLIAASPERQVSKGGPELFIVHNQFDPVSAIPSLRLAIAAKDVGVPCELHLYGKRTHGFGMGVGNATEEVEPAIIWPELFVKFMKRK